jgi:S-adenosylmethionine:tRNA ribosyltransferase-isomerase
VAEELQISEFDYHLPAELIAQEPCIPREAARLLVVVRDSGTISHHHIRDLPTLLRPKDLLIFNNTRVLPARIYGKRAKTGGQWEGLYLRERPELNPPSWELLAQTRGYIQEGEWIDLLDRANQPSPYRLQVMGRTSDRHLLVRPESPISPQELFDKIGHIPLPHYIRHGVDSEEDRAWYQTVYARESGSVAAPTAGLHFSPHLLEQLQSKGIDQSFVTLHVGMGTFAPIKVSNLNEHVMHEEWCELPATTAQAINTCEGRRIAVGTTSVRTLESSPITNFHLPKSTLLVLISALAGRELIRNAYQVAVQERYRFFSYGDAMLIL